MTNRELRRLSRAELLEILTAQTEENDELRRRLEEAEKLLEDRCVCVERAGTLAEASLRLNEVFSAADGAARQYLENVQCLAREGRISA